jgi:FKBP-type peptidyl-prolyl cis-trans isomerase
MKKTRIFALSLPVFALFAACSGQTKDTGRYQLDTDTSYALGMLYGDQLATANLSIDYKAMLDGLKDSVDGKETRITFDQVDELLYAAFNNAMLKKATVFLEENGKKEGVSTTESGLEYEVKTEGSGEKPAQDSTVLVNYTGSLIDGTVFDSSEGRGGPAELTLGNTIPGFTEGIALMNVGSTYKLYIPPELGYGANSPPSIPPNSVLVFEVELVGIAE